MTRILIAFLLFFQVGVACSHDGRPVYLEVNQLSDTEYELAWRIPSTIEPMNLPVIYLEGSCDEKKALSSIPMAKRGSRIVVKLFFVSHIGEEVKMPRPGS